MIYNINDDFRFNDIPSVWWQISTILIGGATAITMIVAVSAVSACCVTHVIQKSTAKVAGYLQLLAGKCILFTVFFWFLVFFFLLPSRRTLLILWFRNKSRIPLYFLGIKKKNRKKRPLKMCCSPVELFMTTS